MNTILMSTLKENIGMPLTPMLAAKIMQVSDAMSVLVPEDEIAKIQPEVSGEFVFAAEKMADILEEIKPLHQAHWKETEEHRHGLEFNPDYTTFIKYERAGRCVVFTLRSAGRLMGNFALYLNKSMHTQTLFATEDTLFLLPEARKGRVSMRFIAYGEKALKQLGVREIDVSVKLVNKAGRFFQMIGYKHVENGLSKILEN